MFGYLVNTSASEPLDFRCQTERRSASFAQPVGSCASMWNQQRVLGVRREAFDLLAQFDPVRICLRTLCCEIGAGQKIEIALFPREFAR